MSHNSNFNPKTIIDLFVNGLITAPLGIRADLGETSVEASLLEDGSVVISGKHHPNLFIAMNATARQQASTSDPWQFWTWFSDERQAWTPLEHLRAKLEFRPIQKEIRTSDTHPLRIDSVSIPGIKGHIGLTFCPGKCCEGLYGGTWDRNLDKDILAIKHWGSNTLISLMEDHEFGLLGVADFRTRLFNSSLQWFHLPIKDMQIPNTQFELEWNTIGPKLHQALADGQSIVIHCRGGLGRTGLLAARMLVEAGLDPVEAIAHVRSARAHSIETYKQEHYVLTQAWT